MDAPATKEMPTVRLRAVETFFYGLNLIEPGDVVTVSTADAERLAEWQMAVPL